MIWYLKEGVGPNDPGDSGRSTDIDPLDGDWQHIRPVDWSIDIGKSKISVTAIWQSGRHLDPTNLPTRLKVTVLRGRKDLPALYEDYVDWGGGQRQLASEAFRDVVEAHDPGVHQFVPVQVENSKGEPVEKQYFWFVPGHRIFAMNAEKTEPPMKMFPDTPDITNPHPGRPAGVYRPRPPVEAWKPVFYREIIGDRDLFCDGEYPRKIFISDLLKQAFEDAGLIGACGRGPILAE
ncbi:DUF1629 domain-containing protein [Roseovarius sp. EL26]|uniref:imm11 family protein n=1 Tax=Roseovarius sp. EL26 TaxID=2126672 RepID=UPI000EA103AA|nr:DUF1629 domain-containing protein [Roseovarius sp. EL26]